MIIKVQSDLLKDFDVVLSRSKKAEKQLLALQKAMGMIVEKSKEPTVKEIEDSIKKEVKKKGRKPKAKK